MHASSLSAHCTYLMYASLLVCLAFLDKTTVLTRVTSTTTTSTSDSASKRGLQASISTCLLVMSSTFLCTPMFYACLGYVLVCDTYLIYTSRFLSPSYLICALSRCLYFWFFSNRWRFWREWRVWLLPLLPTLLPSEAYRRAFSPAYLLYPVHFYAHLCSMLA